MTVLTHLPTDPRVDHVLEVAADEAARRETSLTVFDYLRTGAHIDTASAWRARHEDALGLSRRISRDDVEVVGLWRAGTASFADALLEASRELSASVIVLGVPRRSPVGKFVLGSDHQHVLLRSEVPVLAVPLGEH